MSPALHIMLVHVPHLQMQLEYPISRTTEECSESVMKVARSDIQRHTNNSTAKSTLLTLFRQGCIRSDQQVAAKYCYPPVKHRETPAFAEHLFPNIGQ